MDSQKDRDRHIGIFYNDFKIPIKDIARHYNLAVEVVEGMVTYAPKRNAERKLLDKMPEIFQKWVNGKSHKRLGREYGVDHRLMGRCLKGYGEKLHPKLFEETMIKHKSQTKD